MSLRYLYKMLFTHFSKEMKSVTKIWDQIDEVKRILSKQPNRLDMDKMDALEKENIGQLIQCIKNFVLLLHHFLNKNCYFHLNFL